MPHPDFLNLSLANDGYGQWREPPLPMEGLSLDDPFMGEFTTAQSTHFEALSPFDIGFRIQNIEPGPCEGVSHLSCTIKHMTQCLLQLTGDTTYICEWHDNGPPCNVMLYSSGDLKHSVSQHLHRFHNFLPSSGKSTQKCLWRGCLKELKQESIARHIVSVHLRAAVTCHACGTSFARQDSLRRHMRNSCGACKGEQYAAPCLVQHQHNSL